MAHLRMGELMRNGVVLWPRGGERLGMVGKVARVLVVLCVSLPGCRDTVESPHPGPLVRDSAGIEIVEIGPIDDRIAFRLVEEPEYVVGWEPDGYFFHSVRSGSLDSDGRAVIADGGSHQRVVVISRTGSIEALHGGRGSGPGEFESLQSAYGFANGSLVAQESRGAGDVRVTILDAFGPARTLPPVFLTPIHRALGIDRSSSLTLVPTGIPGADLAPGAWLRVPLVRIGLRDSAVDTVLVYELRGSNNEGIWGTGAVAIVADGFVVARSDRPSIKISDFDGKTRRIVRWEEPFPTGDGQYWEGLADALSQIELHPDQRIDESVKFRQTNGNHRKYFPVPPLAPSIVGDDVGNVWIAQSTPYDVAYYYPRYRVFSSSGEWLGWVEIPERSHILAVRDGKVLLQRYDQYRVPAVALYRLEEVQ